MHTSRQFARLPIAAVLIAGACGFAACAFAAGQTSTTSGATANSASATGAASTAPGAAAKPASPAAAPKPAAAKPAVKPVARKYKPRPKAQMAPTPQRISEIQSALAAQGVYKGDPNGKWDDVTAQAMKNFQTAHGLTPTGKLDALSLQKLGLGSEIAGRAAPLPISQPQSGSGTAAAGPPAEPQTP
jgi:peptidoglycan hydrolase-like protein with peptidoglycan-binding domain